MNNKRLGLIFAALLGLYLLSKLFGRDRERSFDPNIVQIDTSVISQVTIYPAQGQPAFNLDRAGSGWQVSSGGNNYTATSSSINALLTGISEIKADRIVSKNPEKLVDYGLDDLARTRIEVKGGSGALGDIEVGRFNYNQTTRSGISYLKLGGQPEVYSVDGFLSMTLNQAMDNYRNKRVLQTTKADLTRVTCRYGNQTFIYGKGEEGWSDENNNAVDSTKVDRYLNTLASVSGNEFANQASMRGPEIAELVVEGNNMAGPVQIQCFASQDTSHHFIISSSLNAEGQFFSDSSGIYKRLFADFFEARSSE